MIPNGIKMFRYILNYVYPCSMFCLPTPFKDSDMASAEVLPSSPTEWLRCEYFQHWNKNPRLSVRSFAKKMGFSKLLFRKNRIFRKTGYLRSRGSSGRSLMR